MRNATSDIVQAKEAFVTVTGYKRRLPHEIWPCLSGVLPFDADTIIHESYSEINLKIMSSVIFVVVSSPLTFANTRLCKEAYNNIHRMYNQIRR